jgi:hypothetical protein
MAENKGKFITGDDIDKRYTTSLIMLAKLLKTDVEDINDRISWFIENSDLEVKTSTTSDNFSSFH